MSSEIYRWMALCELEKFEIGDQDALPVFQKFALRVEGNQILFETDIVVRRESARLASGPLEGLALGSVVGLMLIGGALLLTASCEVLVNEIEERRQYIRLGLLSEGEGA